MWELVKLLLTLSHGQAQIERGFSTNKDILSTNMAEESVVAYRQVYDGIQSLGVLMEQCITSEMLMHCKSAHSRYKTHMEGKKKLNKESEKERKRKAIGGELNQSQRKKQKLEATAANLSKEADQLAVDAEKNNKMDLLVKSNALRSKAKEKRAEVEVEEDKIKDLKSKLKKL